MKISLFHYSMFRYISPIITFLLYIYRRNSCPTHTPDLTLSTIPPKNISDKFTIIWDLCRFLQPDLISSTIFCKRLDFHFSTISQIYNITLGSSSNDWKHLPIKVLKIFMRTFCYNIKVTNEVTKRLPKLSNKEMRFTLLI